jgi:outer membrane protein
MRTSASLMLKLNAILQRAALCALALFSPVPAHATLPNAQQLAAYEQISETERIKLLMGLAKSAEADQVTYLLKKYPLQGPYAANRTLYLEGMVLKTKGEYTAAARNFRSALASDPKLTLVRSELAETLIILQQDDSALHHLRLLAADAPDQTTASGLRSFIDQIDARTPYKFSSYISFAPSTNLNSGSKHTTVYSPALNMNFDVEQPKSGMGFASGFNAAYSQRLGDDFMVVGSIGTDVRIYKDDIFNSYGFSQSLELRRLISNGHIALALDTSQLLDNQDYKPSYLSYGPRLSVSLDFSSKNHLSVGLMHEWRDTLTHGATDSTALMFDASFNHAWDATFNGTLFGGYDHIKTGNAVSSYQTLSAGLSVYKEFSHGITTKLTGQIAKTDHDGFNGLAGVTRADKKLFGSLTLTKRDFNFYGFAPSATYSFTDNFSNINTYDYVGHTVDFRLTKDF